MTMQMPRPLQSAVDSLHAGELVDVTPLGGDAFRITLDSGERLFGKCASAAPADLYTAERQGLEAIAATGTVATPAVFADATDCLLLDWLDGTPDPDYWQVLGEQLAALHNHIGDSFGFASDNYCGMTPQPNPRMEDGYAFFAEARLAHQSRLAQDAGHLERFDIRRIESIANRLPEWLPEQPPGLIHGDLWGGNIACTAAGRPALIDPAAHYGWHEAELAMTTLFGGFDSAFHDAYEACSNCHRDWRERAGLYNLYHLLNHLNLSGGGYLMPVREVLSCYA